MTGKTAKKTPSNFVPIADPSAPDLGELDTEVLRAMRAAGDEIQECYRVLKKCDANIVGEVIKDQGTFYEMDHYPSGDVYDNEYHSQYYYHAHRGVNGEHGHFHTFLRAKGMPNGVAAVNYGGDVCWPKGDDALAHLVSISMDKYGFPIGLFATNRWVTDETWYPAQDVIEMSRHFTMDHAFPSWPVNRWITAMFCLFRPDIDTLAMHRDQAIDAWSEAYPDRDVFEDRECEITGMLRISVDKRLSVLDTLLGQRSA